MKSASETFSQLICWKPLYLGNTVTSAGMGDRVCGPEACPAFSVFWKVRQRVHRVDDKMLDKDITPGESTFQGSSWGHYSQHARCGPREKMGRVSHSLYYQPSLLHLNATVFKIFFPFGANIAVFQLSLYFNFIESGKDIYIMWAYVYIYK